MLVPALVPPLWRRVTDYRLVEHHGGDASPATTGR